MTVLHGILVISKSHYAHLGPREDGVQIWFQHLTTKYRHKVINVLIRFKEKLEPLIELEVVRSSISLCPQTRDGEF